MEKNRLTQSFKRLLWEQFKEYKKYYFLGILALLGTHLIQSELPFMAKKIADLIFVDNQDLKVMPFILCALGIILFRTTSRVLFFFPARLLQKTLRSEMLYNLETHSPSRFKDMSAGQIFQHLTSDIEQIRALIGFVGLQGVNFIIAFFVLVPKILEFNSKLLIAMTPMVGSFIIFTIIVGRNKKYFKLTQEIQGDVQNVIIETYVGKKTIKNFHAEASFIKLFSDLSLKELYYFYRSSLGISVTMPLITLGIGISMLWGAQIIKAENLGASSLILFSGFIFLFMEPLGYLTWIGVVLSRSHASWMRIQEFNTQVLTQTPLENDLKTMNESVTDCHLKIPYWGKQITLDLKPHAWNVIIARTGDGKSEFLFKSCEALRFKNVNISFIAQDPYIYNDSMRRNIFLGQKEGEAEILEAKNLLKLFGLDYINPNLGQLLDLEVGENGKRLSGGQAKRLCLIRSLLSGAQVIIWDDPFSSVDLILEKEIITQLKKLPLIKEKTILLTSHRLSTVKHSDYVYYLDKDKGLIESGKVTEILNTESQTYEYFKQQMV